MCTEAPCVKQVSAGVFETAGLRGEDKMEDRYFIHSPLPGPGCSAHLLGATNSALTNVCDSFSGSDDCTYLVGEG